jgi:hypothetical protein
MHTMKKIVAWLYWYILRWPLREMAKWPKRIEKGFLGYCCNGCGNCYSWGCPSRVLGRTPYNKFRRYKLKYKKK